MTYLLERIAQNERMTWGRMLNPDGNFVCYILEPGTVGTKDENGKLHPCVPPGIYTVGWYPSPRFGREMLSLIDVPGRSGIEIHAGNKASDSLGCLMPGRKGSFNVSTGEWQIVGGESRPALESLIAEWSPLLKGEGVKLDIQNRVYDPERSSQ
jgi:hypothetical protein